MSVLLIAPQDQQAWLVGTSHAAARDGVPLCASHADRVTVPFGWHLRDDRPAAKPRTRRKSRARKAKTEAPTSPTVTPEAAVDPPAPGNTPTEPAPSAIPAEPAADPAPIEPAATEPAPAAEPVSVEPAVTEPAPDAEPETLEPSAADAETAAVDTTGPTPGPTGDADESPDDRHRSPAEVPVHADDVAAAVAGSGARLTVVPGDDDPSKTFTVEADGQTALWAESHRDDHEPSDETPLLKRAFRVVRED